MENRIVMSAAFVMTHLFHKVQGAVAALNSVEVMVLGEPQTSGPEGAPDFRDTLEGIMKEQLGGVPDDLSVYVVLATNIVGAIERTMMQRARLLAAEYGLREEGVTMADGEEIHLNGPRGEA